MKSYGRFIELQIDTRQDVTIKGLADACIGNDWRRSATLKVTEDHGLVIGLMADEWTILDIETAIATFGQAGGTIVQCVWPEAAAKAMRRRQRAQLQKGF